MSDTTQPAAGPLVGVERMTVRFGSQTVLRDITIGVRRGETLAVMRGGDAEKALAELRQTGFWQDGTLRARPLLHVL